MCGCLEQLNNKTNVPSSPEETKTLDSLSGVVGSECSFSVLLEFAADNDIEAFQRSMTISDVSLVGEIGLWYGRQKCSKQIVLEHRNPLMIAAKYGSVDVVKLILSLSEVDVNLSCGPDKSTALHCAASGGSIRAVEVVKLLLLAGADPCVTDVHGHRPFDVIVAPWNMPQINVALEELLNNDGLVCLEDIQEPTSFSSGSSSLSSLDSDSSSLVLDANIYVVTCKATDNVVSSASERKGYPVDPSIPNIKSSIYSTDEFCMFSFKILPCSCAYSHDWTECPFVHPGENARRRDPRKFHYSGMPCPNFRKGTCKCGDLCEYAHGVFESWLHPELYRTQICKDGTTCNRRVCFFAHRPEELRPLYLGSGIHSPRSAASAVTKMEKATTMNPLPGSPSVLPAMPMSPLSPAMLPPANVISQAPIGWPQHVTILHLPDRNLQGSCVRSSLNARDMPAMVLNMSQDFEMHQQQHFNNVSRLSQPNLTTKSSNLDGLFSTEASSPRYLDVFLNQLHQQERVLSPINSNIFSPKNNQPLLQSAFDASLERISPWNTKVLSPLNPRLSAFTNREKQQQSCHSLSSLEFGYKLSNDIESKGIIGSPVNSCSKENPNGKVDWPVQEDELGLFYKSCSIGHHGLEPAVSWDQSLVKGISICSGHSFSLKPDTCC